KKENKRFQFHFETFQFMDEKDEKMTQDEWEYLRSKYPKIAEVFLSIGKKYIFLTPDDKEAQLAAVENDSYAITYIKNPDKDVQIAAVKQNRYMIKFIKNPDK